VGPAIDRLSVAAREQADRRLPQALLLPDGTRLPFSGGDRNQGFNAVLRTSHRQNFLVPPRRHRSFPLAEL